MAKYEMIVGRYGKTVNEVHEILCDRGCNNLLI